MYTSVDEPVARPVIEQFKRSTGIDVIFQTDTEATKSVGLAERLRAERGNPQADVFWSNEPFHSVDLAAEKILDVYDSPAAAEIAPAYKDPEHRWAGNALRARVIAVAGNPPASGYVSGVSLQDLLAPELAGKVAIASPSAGTTGGHMAALYVLWGEQKASDFLRKLRENRVKVLGGNGPVADAVGRGAVTMGLTDNDDVASARREGGKLAAGLPDQDGEGTLMVPTTVGVVAGAKHPEAARKLVDYLLSAKVERRLIEAQFAGWSVRATGAATATATTGQAGAAAGRMPKAMHVDYAKVAQVMPAVRRKAAAILEGAE